MKSILNIKVSCFENCQSTSPVDVNLLDWLTSDKHRQKVESLRTIQDENLQKVIKASLPVITPSGVFSYRAEKNLIEHSGFLAFDIDEKDNRHIGNFDKLKEQISHVVCVAYCGISVRGKGYWGLVPIPKSTPTEHRYRFTALSKFFKDYGIIMDESGKDICRLRIYSWDPDGYFNHNAKLYTRILIPKQKTYNRPGFSDTRNKVEAIIFQIKENRIDITGDYKEGWLKIASALANEFGESGRGYFHTVSMFHPKYNDKDTDRMFDECLKHNYNKVTIASFFHITDEYGIKLMPEPVMMQHRGEIETKQDGAMFRDLIPDRNKVKTLSDIGITKKESSTVAVVLPKSAKQDKLGIWDEKIKELERFFQAVKLPTEPIKLNQCTKITDISKFINSHLAIAKSQNGNKRYRPYLERLIELKAILTKNLN